MELTSGHLEVLSKLGRCRCSIKFADLFVPNLNPVLDLEKLGFVYREIKRVRIVPREEYSYYQLTTKGERYLGEILGFASKEIKK